MGKKRKYKCKQCKQLEQKINEANNQEEQRAVIFVFFLILFGLLLITNHIFDFYNESTSALEESKTIKNEKKIMELLAMKIQVCNKEDELQPGIYSFHLDSDTSCNTYKSEYRKLEEEEINKE